MKNVSKMTTKELETRLGEVLQELASINIQVDRAKSNAAATGDYGDRNWFQSAMAAKRLRGVEQQLIQAELGKRKKEERRGINNRIERLFIDAAKRRLDPQLFAELMAEAAENIG